MFETALDLAPVGAVLLLLLATWLTWAALAARRGAAPVQGEGPAATRPQPADAQVPAPRRADHDAPAHAQDPREDTQQ